MSLAPFFPGGSATTFRLGVVIHMTALASAVFDAFWTSEIKLFGQQLTK